MQKIVAFPYCGGKYWQLKWLLPLLPKCDHFVEPFCGSAIVSLNREPSALETINDRNGDIVNFFQVLREQSSDLIDVLNLSPHSREEFVRCLTATDDQLDNLERARRFYVRVRQSISGTVNVTQGNWGYVRTKSRTGFRPLSWSYASSVRRLEQIISRIKYWQIENKPAFDIIPRYDSPQTLFYCDPPYVIKARKDRVLYRELEMTDDEHQELAVLLRRCKGRVAISGYPSGLYEELYHDWTRHDTNRVNRWGVHKEHSRGQESLWCNYDSNGQRLYRAL